jgi:mono/diheme cytochrome c family protein
MVATQLGCLGCHTTDGQGAVGPTWLGLVGRTTQLDDGSTVTADEVYIRESILQPSAKVVSGFQAGLMPAGYGDLLTDEQLLALIEFIRTLE